MPSKKQNLKNQEEKVQTAAMRHPALYALSIIILVAIIAAFIVGPLLGRGGQSANSTVFGTFEGENIELVAGTYFARAYQSQLDQLIQQAESQGRSAGLQEAYNAARTAYNSTVFRLALLNEADESGLHVSMEEVNRTLLESGLFNDENGNFSRTILSNALETNPNLQDEYREEIIFTRVQGDMLFEAGLSDAEVEFIAAMGEPRRIFDVISFEFAEYPNSELSNFLDSQTELFQRVVLSSITVNSLEEAEEVLERLENGEVFSDLALELSTDLFSTEGGERGGVWYYDLQRDLLEEDAAGVIFGLGEGETSGIFELRGEKYAIYRLGGPVVQPDIQEDDVLQQVRGYVLGLERGLVSDYFRQAADDFSARVAEIGWASALVESGLSASTTSAVGINYGDVQLFPNYNTVSAGVLSGISSRETLIADLFSLELGEISDVVELQDRITVIRYAEPGEQTAGQDDFLQAYIPYIAQDFLTGELQRIYNSPEYLRDNFDQAFQSLFLGSN